MRKARRKLDWNKLGPAITRDVAKGMTVESACEKNKVLPSVYYSHKRRKQFAVTPAELPKLATRAKARSPKTVTVTIPTDLFVKLVQSYMENG